MQQPATKDLPKTPIPSRAEPPSKRLPARPPLALYTRGKTRMPTSFGTALTVSAFRTPPRRFLAPKMARAVR
ncbi:MAG: hypothetical protein M1826_000820 [Phylliscum demangeonii]|nr:MAG: hypothetical protein M1826_000820 [Phylliscum demangeonii]